MSQEHTSAHGPRAIQAHSENELLASVRPSLVGSVSRPDWLIDENELLAGKYRENAAEGPETGTEAARRIGAQRSEHRSAGRPSVILIQGTKCTQPETASPDSLISHLHRASIRTAWSRKFGGWIKENLQGEWWQEVGGEMAECDALRVYKQKLADRAGEEHPVELFAGDFCGHGRGCLTCAAVRGSRLVQKYQPIIAGEVLRDLYKETVPYHLVLTIRTSKEATLHDCIKRLREALERFKKRRQNNRNRMRADISLALQGGVGQIECKRSEEDGESWHVHMHWLVLGPAWVDFAEFRKMWAECTQQEIANFRLIPLYGWKEFSAGHLSPAEFFEAVGKGCREVLKYAFKVGNPDERQFFDAAQWWQLTQGMRLVRSFGSLYAPGLDLEAVKLKKPQTQYVDIEHFQWASEYDGDIEQHVVFDGRSVEPGEQIHYYDRGKGKRLWVQTR